MQQAEDGSDPRERAAKQNLRQNRGTIVAADFESFFIKAEQYMQAQGYETVLSRDKRGSGGDGVKIRGSRVKEMSGLEIGLGMASQAQGKGTAEPPRESITVFICRKWSDDGLGTDKGKLVVSGGGESQDGGLFLRQLIAHSK
jgi:hypothetical protein